MWNAARLAALDMCIGRTAAFLDLDKRFSKSSYLSNTGCQFSLTEKGCTPQWEHIDFQVHEEASPGYFIVFSCEEGSSL